MNNKIEKILSESSVISVDNFNKALKYIKDNNILDGLDDKKTIDHLFGGYVIPLLTIEKFKDKKITTTISGITKEVNVVSFVLLSILYGDMKGEVVSILLSGEENKDIVEALRGIVGNKKMLEAQSDVKFFDINIKKQKTSFILEQVEEVPESEIEDALMAAGTDVEKYKKACLIVDKRSEIPEKERGQKLFKFFLPLLKSIACPLGHATSEENELSTMVLRQGNLSNLAFLLMSYTITESKLHASEYGAMKAQQFIEMELSIIKTLFKHKIKKEYTSQFKSLIEILKDIVGEKDFNEASKEYILAKTYYSNEVKEKQ